MTKHFYYLLLPLQISFICCYSDAALSPAENTIDPSPDFGLNLPARPTIEHGYNLWIQGEGLYWKAAEENIPYVIVKQQSHPSMPAHNTIKEARFDWNGGYRLSAGYMIPHGKWDIAAIWTSISNQGSRSDNASIPPDTVINLIEPVGYQNTITGIITHSDGKWGIDLSQIDLNLGKEFYVSRSFKLRPMGGLRSAWIDHKAHYGYLDHNDGITDMHSVHWDFWGFGFLAGLQADWMLASDWSLFSFADYSLLWGFSKIRQHSPETDYHFRKSFRCARAVYDLGMGIKWSHAFSNQRWRLSFKAAYEYHLYPQQNQMLENMNQVQPGLVAGAFTNHSGDLSYQGGSFSAQIDF